MSTINTKQKKVRNYRASDMDTDYITFVSKVTPISKKHVEGRTSIPRPIMLAMGIDIGDTISWTVNKAKKTIELSIKKQIQKY